MSSPSMEGGGKIDEAEPLADDAVLAANWYAWWRLHEQIRDFGPERRSEMSAAIGKVVVHGVLNNAQGVGIKQAKKIAVFLGISLGRFFDDAMAWWRASGQRQRIAATDARAAAVRAGEPKPKLVPILVPAEHAEANSLGARRTSRPPGVSRGDRAPDSSRRPR